MTISPNLSIFLYFQHFQPMSFAAASSSSETTPLLPAPAPSSSYENAAVASESNINANKNIRSRAIVIDQLVQVHAQINNLPSVVIKKATSFWTKFMAFVDQGNAFDLAVGLILGSAFSVGRAGADIHKFLS